jgi:O-antigen ligase
MPAFSAPPTFRLILWGLIALVALAPLPLGSNRPLPAVLLLAACGILLILFSAAAAPHKKRPGLVSDRYLLPAFSLYGVVLGWAFLQATAIPTSFPGIVQSWANPIWTEASAALMRPLSLRISINPAATIHDSFLLIAYAAIFWLSLQITRDLTNAGRARLALVATGSVYSLYGLFDLFGGADWFVGNVSTGPASHLTSSFVNRNSYATFAGLTLLAATSLFLERIHYILSLERPLRRKAALVIEHMIFQSGWLTGATLLIMLALFLTASRGGILASLFALCALVVLQLPRRGQSLRQPIAFIVVSLVGLAVIVAGGNLLDRLEKQGLSLETDLRGRIFATTMDAIQTAPLTGLGFGTYEDAIEPYRAGDPNIFTLWEKAHNSYLENALELGLPATFALTLSIFLLTRIAFRGVRNRRRHKGFPALGVAATLLVGLHALVDFSLQIPAVAVLYAFMMGLAVTQSLPSTKAPKSSVKA